uniref:CUB domain-containing protein n=1 Tax=Steinernema glaseri TaxID=37863 RepID=A0A1I7Y4B7_9BILA
MNFFCALLSSLFLSTIYAFDGSYEQLDSCHAKIHKLHFPRQLAAFPSRRSQMCSLVVRAEEGHSVRITFHSLRRACNMQTYGLFIHEQDKPPVNMVVVEELHLSRPDCESSVSIVMGPHFRQYEYRAAHFCKQHNGLTEVVKKVVCHRGLLVFKTSPDAKDFVRFRLEIPEEHEERPFLVHNLDC